MNIEIRIKKTVSYSLLSLLLITSFPLYASSPIQAQEQIYPSTQSYDKASTNQLTKELKLTVERLSDAEVLVKGPNNVVPDSVRNLTTRADSNGKTSIAIPIGTQKDDPSICSPSLERGLGVSDELVLRQAQHDTECQDGEYTVTIASIDAAGNRSEATVLKIIRDTIAPRTPEVSEPYICNQKDICIDLTGEAGTEILVNNQQTKVIATGSKQVVILQTNYVMLSLPARSSTAYAGGSKHNFNISLKDKATNVSGQVERSFTTPNETLAFRGSIEGASDQNPYGNQTGSRLQPVIFDVSINPKNETKIENMFVPAPTLTHIYTQYDNKIDIYGVGITKGHELNINAKFEFYTDSAAKKECNWNFLDNILGNSSKESCIEKLEAKERYKKMFGKILGCELSESECGYINIDENKKVIVLTDLKYSIDHSMISFYNDSTGRNYLSHLWNDDSEGKFRQTEELVNDLASGQSVVARSEIFGSINIEGTTVSYSNNNQRLKSKFSNSLTIDISEYIELNGKQAKVLDVPYFNQYLEPNGTNHPPDGWQMCGAAASVMVAGYFKKLSYTSEAELKKYMYGDNGQGITISYGDLKGGAFGLTNWNCNENWDGGIVKYMDHIGVKVNFIAGQGVDANGIFVGSGQEDLTFQKVKNSIDNNRPIVVQVVGHIFVVKGYTKDGLIVVNDSWTNRVDGTNYSYSGKDAIYDLNDFPYTIVKAAEYYL